MEGWEGESSKHVEGEGGRPHSCLITVQLTRTTLEYSITLNT